MATSNRRCGIAGAVACPVGRGGGLAEQRMGLGRDGPPVGTGIALEKLPEDIPAFARDPAVLPELTLMTASLTDPKGAGETHDK